MGTEWAAHDLSYAAASEQNIDLMVINESNKKILPKPEWLKDMIEKIRASFAAINILKKVREYNVYKCYIISKCYTGLV